MRAEGVCRVEIQPVTNCCTLVPKKFGVQDVYQNILPCIGHVAESGATQRKGGEAVWNSWNEIGYTPEDLCPYMDWKHASGGIVVLEECHLWRFRIVIVVDNRYLKQSTVVGSLSKESLRLGLIFCTALFSSCSW